MYIFLHPDGSIEIRDHWFVEDSIVVGTYIYEPSDAFWPWTLIEINGPRGIHRTRLPDKCKAIEVLYPWEGLANMFTSNLCQEILDPKYKG